MPVNLGSAEGYIDLDFSNVKKGVQSAISALDKLDSVYTESESFLRKMEAELKNAGGVFQAAAQKSKQLSTELNAAQKKTEVYRKAIDGMNSVIRNASQAQTALQPEIQKTTERLNAAEQKVKELSAAYKTAAKATKDAAKAHGEQSEEAQKAAEAEAAAKEELDKASKSADQYRNSLLQMQTQHAKLGQEIEGAKDKTSEFRTALNNTEAKIANLRQELYETQSVLVTFGTAAQNAGDKWQAAGSKINNVGNILTLGVTTPIIRIGTAAVKAGNDFEAQMSRVSAIAGAYGNDLEKLRQQAIDLGADTSFSATSAAEAMENLASAGFDTQEIMEAMPGMLNLAASSGEDLASSADIAASTLRAFQLEASEAGHVADVLAKNAADTNAAISDTGLAMKYVAPVAQSAGWSLEEVAAAIGVLADANIKGEQAGTTLRGALTSLMGTSDEAQKAMDDLGITFYDAQGKMKPLSTIIDELQKSTEGLTDEQRDNRLVTIFGTDALSGMKVLLASSKEKLDSLTEGLKNADGASKKMSDTMMDNTKGSVEAMNGSLETAAITIQKQLAPWITKGAKQVTEWANGFAELDENTQGTILSLAGVAAAAGPVTKGIGSVTGGIGKLVKGTGGLIKDIGKLSSAKKAAQAIGEIGTFSTKSVSGVSGLSKALFNLKSPAGLAVGAATLLTGAIVGIGAAVKKAHDDMVKADIAERFGDIELSAEEVEGIVKRLTTNDWTMKIDAVIDAKEKLGECRKTVEDAVAEMDKLGWKVGVGLELTKEEQETFQSSAKQFIDSTTQLLEQQEYTATLAIDTVFTPGTSEYDTIKSATSELYSSTRKELEWLGQEYAKTVNESFADGVLTEDENLNLETLRQRIQNLVDEVSSAKYTGKLTSLEMQFPDADITPESFQELQQGIAEALKEMSEKAQETYTLAVTSIELAYKEGLIDDTQRQQLLDQVNANLNRDQADIVLDGLGVQIRKINAKYEDAVGLFGDEFAGDINLAINNALNAQKEGGKWENLWFDLEGAVRIAHDKLDPKVQGGIRSLINEMQPTTADLEKIAKSYQELGKVPPENVTKGLLDVYYLEAMTGNADHMYEILANQIATSPEAQKAVQYAVKSGDAIPEELAKALRDNYGLVYDGGENIFKQVQAPVPTKVQEIKDIMSKSGLEISDSLAESLANKGADIQNKTLELLNKINEGEALKEEELELLLSNLGIKSADALISSLGSKKPEVQDQTVQLLAQISGGVSLEETDIRTLFENLGLNASDAVISAFAEKEPSVQAEAIGLLSQLQNAETEKRPEILKQLSDLGVSVDDSLGSGIENNSELVKSKSQEMIDGVDATTQDRIATITPNFAECLRQMGVTGFDAMDTEMTKSDLSAPGIEELSPEDANEWGKKTHTKLQNALNHVAVGVDAVIKIANAALPGHADGGIFYTPHVAAFAEDGPEAVVPLSAARRTQGIEIWREAGQLLGASNQIRGNMSYSSSDMGIDYHLLAKTIAAEMRKAPLEVNSNIALDNHLQIDLDSEIIGRKTAPTVSRILSKK